MTQNALVFGGGGARGAYEIGVWKALRELEIEFSIVTGTSVGALNGALFAQGDYDKAEALWSEIDTPQVLRLSEDDDITEATKLLATAKTYLQNVHKYRSVGLDTSPLLELITAHVDENAVRRSPILFGLTTVMLDGKSSEAKEYFIDQIPQGQLHQYLMASSALFPALAYQLIDGKIHVDGGYHDNVPTNMALNRGAEMTLSVDLNAVGIDLEPKPSIGQRCELIRPCHDLGPVLNFTKEQSRRNIRLGYLDAMKHYGRYRGRYFTFLPTAFCRISPHDRSKLKETARLLRCEERNPLGKLSASTLRREITKRCSGDPQIPETLFFAGAEAVGKIFGAEPTRVYSEEAYLSAIQRSVREYVLHRKTMDEFGFNRRKTIQKTIETLDDKGTVTILCRQLKSVSRGGSRAKLRALASLRPDEFLAAVFLWVSGIKIK
ncbi:MAG: patatin-like phospholipase family protein [Bacillota bacterium]|nr:patatin-like phospholipase family protein [Bacillota bacterium]